jgi:hypothetical protein
MFELNASLAIYFSFTFLFFLFFTLLVTVFSRIKTKAKIIFVAVVAYAAFILFPLISYSRYSQEEYSRRCSAGSEIYYQECIKKYEGNAHYKFTKVVSDNYVLGIIFPALLLLILKSSKK